VPGNLPKTMQLSEILKNKIIARALLVDLDNVLIFGDKTEVVERLYATTSSLSFAIGKEQLRQICEQNNCMIEMISEIIKDENISREEFEKEKEKFDGKFDELLSLGDEVIATLNYFKELNIPLAIVSTRTSSAIPRILKKRKILKYFDVIVGRNECKDKKPSPEPIEYALKQLGIISKENVYMIGDRQNIDIQAAINAGVNSILVNKNLDEQGARPTLHVEQFKDLRTLKIFKDPS